MNDPEREPKEIASLAELFDYLLGLPDESQRVQFLDELRARDPELARRLRRLLAAHTSAEQGQFLECCAAEALADLAQRIGSDVTLVSATGLVNGDAPTLEWGHKPKAAPPPPAVPNRIAHYRLLYCVGQGGMGWVYRAVDEKLGRVVALKVCQISGTDWSTQVRTLYDEAKLAAQLDHPNIISVYDAGFDGGWQYVAMQFVEGETLGEVLSRGPLRPRVAVTLVRTIAQAVHYAHEHGVVHRDIKPGNVLLARKVGPDPGDRFGVSDPLGLPRIGDFGLARLLNTDDTVTQTTVICGTPSYMAPEQATSTSGSIDRRTDVYSLGAVLYACLTGVPPFEGATPLETVCKLLEEDPVPLRKLNRTIPVDLELIVMKCLRKEPDLRYQTVQEFIDDLDRFLKDEPVLARKGAFLYRWCRWCRRERGLIMTLLTLAFFLGLLGVVAGLAIDSGRRARQEMAAIQAELRERQRTGLLSEAVAATKSVQPGRRWRALHCLTQAAKLGTGPDIRDLAAYSLQLFDVYVEKEWDLAPNDQGVAISPDLTRFVTFGAGGNWSVGEMETGEIVREHDSLPHGRTFAELSKGAKYLALYDGHTGKLSILNCDDGDAVISLETFPGSDAYAFHPVDQLLVAQLRDGAVVRYELDKGESATLTRAPPSRRLVFDGRGDRFILALRDAPAVNVYGVEGQQLYHVHLGEIASTATLDRSGRLLAVGHPSGRVAVWKLDRVPRLLRSWQAHDRWINGLTFASATTVLVSRSWDGTTAYWDYLAPRELLRSPHYVATAKAEDGGVYAFWTNTAFGLIRMVRPAAWREIHGGEGELSLNWWGVDFVEKQGLLLCAGDGGLYLWDVWNHAGLGWVERAPIDGVAYLAEKGECIYAARGKVWSRKLTVVRTRQRRRVVVGRPTLLYDGKGGYVRFGASDTGESLLITNSGTVFHMRRGQGVASLVRLGRHANTNGGSVGPDGRWFLTQTWGGKGVFLWRAGASKPIDLWPGAPNAMVGTFAGGKVAWASTGRMFRFWRTDSWEQVAVLDREELTDFPGALAVSNSAGLMAVAMTRKQMRLMTVPPECKTVVALPSPFPGDLRQITFDDTGRFLAAATDRSVQLWDLQTLREELGRLGIECAVPSFRKLPAVTRCELILEQ